ncbi:acetate--CoA ligase family protein [Roseinatronobacter alkalisoli]|uniref:Acetate--CoA ligase family protein n=1 Tax=Roseinatronobacter alkalisoli TaxID=3028235 RepID=A0ABT5TEG3_9RHOB|nr:acetate--CoA ligase family protein [Roseinatronobacter sp. HJB301]MDD7973100.1 acetate--CoA ligase family protein [Roseinatronobacter sp. HJB301]
MTKRTDAIPMNRVIAPASIALIGASEDYAKFGGRILHHLVDHGFGGRIYPINPKRESVLGLPCYKSVADLPDPADIALLAVPAATLEENVDACGRAGIGACIIITAQLGEFSAEGAALETRIVAIAQRYNMRLMGPNCMGMIIPQAGLALSSTPTLRYAKTLRKGGVAFVSQSGAMMGTLFLQAHDHGVGLSGMVSIGNQADLELCDFLDGFIADPKTQVICLYIEGLKSPERFRALCLQARAAGKPVLVVKAGRTEAGTHLAKSHTASLAGSYSAFETLCREVGVVLMDDPDAMILCAGILAANPRPATAAAGIICASGGGAAIMADQLALRDLQAGRFATATLQRLEQDYPASHQNNPLDLGGHKGGLEFGIFARAIDAVHADPGTGITVYVMTPQPMMPQTLEHIISVWQRQEKPVILVLNLSHFGADLRERAFEAGIPFVTRTDDLYRVLQAYRDELTSESTLRHQEPERPTGLGTPDVTADGFLTEPQAKAVLAGYDVSVPAAQLTGTIDEAVLAAQTCGYPVVLKGVLADVVHKSDAGLVKVGLETEQDLRAAFSTIAQAMEKASPGADIRIDVQQMITPGIELIVGLKNEPGYGPQLILGAGGIHVELLRDVVQRRAPVTPQDVRKMLESLRLWPLLSGARGQTPLAIDAACAAIARMSWLGPDLGDRLRDFEINPFRITETGAYALDGRGTLESPAP